ncbi:unnamed protein product [Mycena citricolor]|uniref:Uncharacterized protein n=1 Tax=Mycena citricolor TaxID=2018698 RepID=A0AAD2GTJ1_9AGAR|nr:unnamed protein product [Mycena citricolor]
MHLLWFWLSLLPLLTAVNGLGFKPPHTRSNAERIAAGEQLAKPRRMYGLGGEKSFPVPRAAPSGLAFPISRPATTQTGYLGLFDATGTFLGYFSLPAAEITSSLPPIQPQPQPGRRSTYAGEYSFVTPAHPGDPVGIYLADDPGYFLNGIGMSNGLTLGSGLGTWVTVVVSGVVTSSGAPPYLNLYETYIFTVDETTGQIGVQWVNPGSTGVYTPASFMWSPSRNILTFTGDTTAARAGYQTTSGTFDSSAGLGADAVEVDLFFEQLALYANASLSQLRSHFGLSNATYSILHGSCHLSNTQVTQIQARVDMAETERTKLMHKINEIKADLMFLEKDERRISKHLTLCRATLAPIRCLPEEALSLIFAAYAPHDARDATTGARWAIATPALWTTISYTYKDDVPLPPKNKHNAMALLELCIERSGRQGLSIELQCGNSQLHECDTVLLLMGNHRARWETVHIDMPMAMFNEPLFAEPLALPLLWRLRLNVHPTRRPPPALSGNATFSVAPLLTDLELTYGVDGNFLFLLPWAQITTYHGPLYPGGGFDALSVARRAESILDQDADSIWSISQANGDTFTTHTHLRVLVLSSQIFPARMSFPSLRQLDIRAGTLGAETRALLVMIEKSGPRQLETLVARGLVLSGKDIVYDRLTALLKLVPWLMHLCLDRAADSSGSDALFDDLLDYNDIDRALLPSFVTLMLNGFSLGHGFIRFLEDRREGVITTLECLELKRVHEKTTDVLQKIRKIAMQGGDKGRNQT